MGIIPYDLSAKLVSNALAVVEGWHMMQSGAYGKTDGNPTKYITANLTDSNALRESELWLESSLNKKISPIV